MEPHVVTPRATVSNLVPSWDGGVDGGGSFAPAAAAAVVEQSVSPGGTSRRPARLVSPPGQFAPTERSEMPSTFSYDQLAGQELAWDGTSDLPLDDDGLPAVDYDALPRRDIVREVLRARLVAIAEQRELRSAYEVAFIMLAVAIAILLAAPPLVQVLLAAHGIQA